MFVAFGIAWPNPFAVYAVSCCSLLPRQTSKVRGHTKVLEAWEDPENANEIHIRPEKDYPFPPETRDEEGSHVNESLRKLI